MNDKCFFLFCILLIISTDLAIFLNIPFLRQILGFLFLTFLPGLLILQILKLNKIGSIEKFVLSVGLSISFLMFFGLLINNLSLSLGYETPLSTIPLLISFNLAFIVLAIIGYKINKESIFSLPNIELSTYEKAFLIVPILFPALSVFGMHIMNTTDNNIILMFMLFLIPIYVASVCFFNHKFSKRLYPVVIALIGISLLLLMALRSNHLIGVDTHFEYHYFQLTMDNLHWGIFGYTTLDVCLSISILPMIYQSILNIAPEFLFRILYPLIYSTLPLIIYIISKRYIGELYGFLASCFFMFQHMFLETTANSRTCTAILFFALAMMVLFSDKIDPLKKRILFIVFMASCMVSHYATTYIFFFIMLGDFVGMEILSKKHTFKKTLSLTIVFLFFALIFFWYSQVTSGATFNDGIFFVENAFTSLNQFFVEESRGSSPYAMLGEGIMLKGIPHKMQFVFTWLTFALIGIGVLTLIIRHKELSFPELQVKKPDFLTDKFEVTYFMIVLLCAGLLTMMVALPYISKGYDMFRLYNLVLTILSVFFVVGGIIIAKYLNKHFLRKKSFTKRSHYQRNNRENGSQVLAYLVILLVLIPYFLCTNGVMYNIFGVPRAIILNSEGEAYERYYTHDHECSGAKWLKTHGEGSWSIRTDWGGFRLESYGTIPKGLIYPGLVTNRTIGRYIYLGYYNVVTGKFIGRGGITHNLLDYQHHFVGTAKIYANGGSEVYVGLPQ